jgi:hypothetical protein
MPGCEELTYASTMDDPLPGKGRADHNCPSPGRGLPYGIVCVIDPVIARHGVGRCGHGSRRVACASAAPRCLAAAVGRQEPVSNGCGVVE